MRREIELREMIWKNTNVSINEKHTYKTCVRPRPAYPRSAKVILRTQEMKTLRRIKRKEVDR